ncbi:MAG: UvrD-helicase domain-containing protein [Myxococcales bacterium]|nr:UvrD-helicase domain-containing protein [Myxococcales bacterium]MCB9704353.1 UvrD-helicase domain-containing protein [Myxococcales bacterium]
MALDLSHLNPNQRRAVLHIDGPLLVLAGAGSGKTRVITHRIVHMLERGIEPGTIVALSFTNKAADEMRERLVKMIGREAASALVLGTFHSVGAQMMRETPEGFGVPKRFSILDQGDQYGLCRAILRDLGHHGPASDRRFDLGAIVQRISLWKNEFVTPAQAADPRRQESDYDTVAAEIYPEYEDRLAGLGAVDFDDLVCRIAHRIDEDPELCAYWRGRFHYLLIDEYQDTNRAQLEVVRRLAGPRENICVVGDDDQAIYGWRGAKVSNILGFDMYFPRAVTIKLEENYRSRPPIVECANGVIVNNLSRHDKALIPQRGGGAPVTLVVAEDGPQETSWVTGKIRKLIVDERIPPEDIAVLYRSAKQATPIEEGLQEHGIAYRVLGGQTFYDRKQVKDVLAYLRLLVAPRDDLGVRRALDVPSRGIGAKTVARLDAYARERHLTLLEAIHRAAAGEVDELQPRAAHALERFSEMVKRGQAQHHAVGSAVTALRSLITASGLKESIVGDAGSAKAGDTRWQAVEGLLASLERFEGRARERGERPRWNDYLATMNRDSKDGEEIAPAKVTLTTLHSAKGLEWPVVFILGAEEGTMPHKRVSAPRISDAISGDIEEERRLFYVAITRARDTLYITRAEARVERGQPVKRVPSRFLAEIPEEHAQVYTIAREEALTTDDLMSMADAFMARLQLPAP